MEAALLLPSLLLVVGLMVQPICLFYTRAVMNAAASEGARLLLTKSTHTSEEEITSFLKRRLRAVPSLAIFHEGGEDGWDITYEIHESLLSVGISSKVKPLPLFGFLSALLTGSSDGEGTIQVRVEESLRPHWVSGSYENWMEQWEE